MTTYSCGIDHVVADKYLKGTEIWVNDGVALCYSIQMEYDDAASVDKIVFPVAIGDTFIVSWGMTFHQVHLLTSQGYKVLVVDLKGDIIYSR
jgi:hypothetical protein